MNSVAFMKWLVGTFGNMGEAQAKAIVSWAKKQDEGFLNKAIEVIKEAHESDYPPKLGDIYRYLRDANLIHRKDVVFDSHGDRIYVSRCEFCHTLFPTTMETCPGCNKMRHYGGIAGLNEDSEEAKAFLRQFAGHQDKLDRDQRERIDAKRARLAEGALPPEELARHLIKPVDKSVDTA